MDWLLFICNYSSAMAVSIPELVLEYQIEDVEIGCPCDVQCCWLTTYALYFDSHFVSLKTLVM